MLHDIVFDELPTLSLPEYVSIVNEIETRVPVVFWLAKLIGGVQLMFVEDDFVTIVPLAVPHLYIIV